MMIMMMVMLMRGRCVTICKVLGKTPHGTLGFLLLLLLIIETLEALTLRLGQPGMVDGAYTGCLPTKNRRHTFSQLC